MRLPLDQFTMYALAKAVVDVSRAACSCFVFWPAHVCVVAQLHDGLENTRDERSMSVHVCACTLLSKDLVPSYCVAENLRPRFIQASSASFNFISSPIDRVGQLEWQSLS